ncbi:MAG: hypothetical protein II942_02705 [Alphaproteobacteria bacterium]|nr:hypothetical protein [Alphaproteobacteria bacterium]
MACLWAQTAVAFGGGGSGRTSAFYKHHGGVDGIGIHYHAGQTDLPDISFIDDDSDPNGYWDEYGVKHCHDGYILSNQNLCIENKCADFIKNDCQTACDPETGKRTFASEDTPCGNGVATCDGNGSCNCPWDDSWNEFSEEYGLPIGASLGKDGHTCCWEGGAYNSDDNQYTIIAPQICGCPTDMETNRPTYIGSDEATCCSDTYALNSESFSYDTQDLTICACPEGTTYDEHTNLCLQENQISCCMVVYRSACLRWNVADKTDPNSYDPRSGLCLNETQMVYCASGRDLDNCTRWARCKKTNYDATSNLCLSDNEVAYCQESDENGTCIQWGKCSKDNALVGNLCYDSLTYTYYYPSTDYPRTTTCTDTATAFTCSNRFVCYESNQFKQCLKSKYNDNVPYPYACCSALDSQGRCTAYTYYTPGNESACVSSNCANNQELVLGQCLDKCQQNATRNSSLQCICNSGYEEFKGQCLANCKSWEYRDQETGVCITKLCDEPGYVRNSSTGACVPCDDESAIPVADQNHCSVCNTTDTPRFFSSRDNKCYLCSTTASVTIQEQDAQQCPAGLRTYQSGRFFLTDCGEGNFHGTNGSCISCASPLLVRNSNEEWCSECDSTNYPRFLDNANQCLTCSIDYGQNNNYAIVQNTTKEQCGKCKNSSTPRYLMGGSTSGTCNLCRLTTYSGAHGDTQEQCDICAGYRTMRGTGCVYTEFDVTQASCTGYCGGWGWETKQWVPYNDGSGLGYCQHEH